MKESAWAIKLVLINNSVQMQNWEYTSARYRFATLSRRYLHRADIEPLYKHAVGLISAMSGEHRPPCCRYRPDIGPMWASEIKPTLSRPCRHRADVEPLCKHAVGPISAMSGEHRPPFCRYRADVGSDIARHRADVGPMCLCCLGKPFLFFWDNVFSVFLCCFCCYAQKMK